jgi:hypothetical protein
MTNYDNDKKMLIKYYEDRLSMMASKAWRDLIEDVKSMIDSNNNIMNIHDEKTLHFKRGEISIMNWILSLEEMTRIGYEQQKEESR